MPFRSRRQWRLFGAKLRRGEISRATFDEFAHASDYSKLPEKVKKPKSAKSASRARKARAIRKAARRFRKRG